MSDHNLLQIMMWIVGVVVSFVIFIFRSFKLQCGKVQEQIGDLSERMIRVEQTQSQIAALREDITLIRDEMKRLNENFHYFRGQSTTLNRIKNDHNL